MKLGLIVIGLFIVIGMFLLVWYNIERMQDELEHIDQFKNKDGL